ncbi:MAG: molecular chaperone DnaJ [bacterium]
MEKRDFYDVLGVNRGASKEEIRKAYRSLARRYHPDVNPGDPGAEKRFKEISEAYQVLSDDSKRSAYDRFGHEGLSGAGMDFGFSDFGFGGFSDIFDTFFGGRGARRARPAGPARGADLRYDMTISLADAAFGTEEQLSAPDLVECEKCRGTGSRSGAHRVACSTCAGTGEVRRARQTVFGQFVNITTCPDCRGEAKVVPDPCGECRGAGFVRGERKVLIKVPPGVASGTRLRLMGEGEPGEHGGPRGDLYVFVSVREHGLFRRDGENLHCEAPISFFQAALGDEIEVPTLYGAEKIRIPPGTQNGARFRLRGKGMPVLKSPQRGDLIVSVSVQVPRRLSRKQKELLTEFAREDGEESLRPQKSFFKRFKDLLD